MLRGRRGQPVGNGSTQHFFVGTSGVGDVTLTGAIATITSQDGNPPHPKLVLSNIDCERVY